MKHPRLLTLLLAALSLFFSLQLLSHLFFALGWFAPAAAVFPLDPRPRHAAAFARLESAAAAGDAAGLKGAIRGFERALARNPLYHPAHLDRGRALHRLQQLGEPVFDETVAAYRRLLLLRWKNPEVSLEPLDFLLSVWPLLNEDDRRAAESAFGKMTAVLYGDRIDGLLDRWALSVRDPAMLARALGPAPRHLKKAAAALARLETGMARRRRFLARYERYVVESFRYQYEHYRRSNGLTRKILLHLFNHLDRGVTGYHALAPDVAFPADAYRSLAGTLLRGLLDGDLDHYRRTGAADDDLWRHTDAWLRILDEPADRAALEAMLDGQRFFEVRGLDGLVRALGVLRRLGRDDRVHALAEKTIAGRAFLTAGEEASFAEILCLAAEVRLLRGEVAPALARLRRALDLAPGSEAARWLLRQAIHRAPELRDTVQAFAPDLALAADPPELMVKDSRRSATVYLEQFPGLRVKIGEQNSAGRRGKHLLRVFVDGRIAWETYLSGVGDTVEVPLPGRAWQKVEVDVRLE